MGRRASATAVLVAMSVVSLVADVAASHEWMAEKHRFGWGLAASFAFLIWAATMVMEDA